MTHQASHETLSRWGIRDAALEMSWIYQPRSMKNRVVNGFAYPLFDFKGNEQVSQGQKF